MRRSRRFALIASCALAALVAAGRLATLAAPRADARSEAATAHGSVDVAKQSASSSHPRIAAVAERDDASVGAADLQIAPLARFESASDSAFDLAARPPDGAFARPIELDEPQPRFGSAVAILGHDPAAPRAIELWRLVDGRSARVAIGQSRSDGTLDLPALVLPAGEVVLVASPRGAGPDAAVASAPVRTSRDPSAPRLVARDEAVAASGAGTLLSLQIEAAEPGGAIVVARSAARDASQTAHEVEIARVAVVTTSEGIRAPLEVAVALEAGDTELLVAQQLEDGRRSPWRVVVLSDQPKENEDVVAVVEEAQP